MSKKSHVFIKLDLIKTNSVRCTDCSPACQTEKEKNMSRDLLKRGSKEYIGDVAFIFFFY